MRCSRFFICWVSPGVHDCSAWIPTAAAVSVCPTPPAPIATAITGAWAAGCCWKAALELEPAEGGGVEVDLVAVVGGDHDLLPHRNAVADPGGDVTAFGAPG